MKQFILIISSIFLFLLCSKTSAQISSWDQLGLYGGDVRVFANDTQNNLYAGTAGGGIFISTNNGSNWIYSGLSTSTVRSILPLSSGDVYVGTEYGLFKKSQGSSEYIRILYFGSSAVRSLAFKSSDIFAGTDNGIYRSSDNGTTWTYVDLSSSAIRVLSVAPNGDIYAGTSGQGIYKSTNGTSWNAAGLSTYMVRSIAFASNGNIYTGTYGGVFKSSDSGAHWNLMGLDGLDVPQVAVKSSGQIFAATWEGVFTSTTNGSTWDLIGFSETITWSLFIDNTGNVLIGRDGEGIYKSTDNGTNWSEENNGLTAARVQVVAIDYSGKLFAGVSGGAFKSTNNGVEWTRILTSVYANRVYSFLFNNNNDYFMGTSRGLYRSSDQGDTWNFLALPDASVKAVRKNSLGYLFAGTDDGFYRSTDNGFTWTLNVGGIQSTIVNDVEVASNNIIFATVSGYSSLYKSTNHGYTWYASASGLSNSSAYDLYIDMFGMMYVINSSGTYKSTNSGSYWAPFGLTGSSVYVDTMKHVFLGTYGGGLNYMPDTSGWLLFDIGPENKNISFVTGDKLGFLYLGTFGGSIYKSKYSYTPVELASFTSEILGNNISLSWKTATEINNKGFFVERKKVNVWEEIAFVSGKGTTSVISEYSYVDKNLNAGKYSYRLRQVDFSGEQRYSNIIASEVTPSGFTLLQNYPNPFNPSTTIKFSVPTQQRVHLKVYDILGTEYSELFNNIAEPGKVYNLTFKPIDAASGIYFYKLITENQTLIRKMILTK